MKQQLSPAVIALVIVVVVIGLGVWLYRAMQPAYYLPSPGAGGRPGRGVPSYAKAPAPVAEGARSTPAVPPPGSRAGDPRSLRH
ncbi:MAG TPA: hypothetical protein VKT32_03355 [Chthonomonadaceae bacterium]|nr:hypothetical protein [Chthonomonadaceae bacterium]